jgi:hypothetical protein
MAAAAKSKGPVVACHFPVLAPALGGSPNSSKRKRVAALYEKLVGGVLAVGGGGRG